MKKGNLLVLLAIGLLAGGVANAQKSESPQLKTVPSVDLKRYAGKWYEIGKYPNKFQKDCVGNTSAEYALKEGGKIEVINTCITKEGVPKVAKGEAKVVDKTTNAKLKVRFAPSALSFLPFVWGDYWITELGENYDYAVIGDPKREYFWILSRQPEMNDTEFQAILRRAEAQGFQPGRVERTSQKVEAVKGTVIERN